MVVFDPTLPETWHPIPNFEMYELSTHLRARSCLRALNGAYRNPRPIKVHTNNQGYAFLVLRKDGRSYYRTLHRIVAQLAFGPIPPGLNVLHRDDIKANNWPSNLYFGTIAENMVDRIRNGRAVYQCGSDRYNAKLDEAAVRKIRRAIKRGTRVASIAKHHGVSRAMIWKIQHRQKWKHVV